MIGIHEAHPQNECTGCQKSHDTINNHCQQAFTTHMYPSHKCFYLVEVNINNIPGLFANQLAIGDLDDRSFKNQIQLDSAIDSIEV
jgi:hypothetical protein